MQLAGRGRSTTVRVVGALAAVIVCAAVAAPATAQMPATGRVVVVHGLRGQLVDVYLDGELALPAFEPDRLTDPLDVPAGDHEVDLREPDTAADSEPFASATITVTGGADHSVLAHLSSSGEPMITAYEDPVTAVAPGQSDVLVRHGAAGAADRRAVRHRRGGGRPGQLGRGPGPGAGGRLPGDRAGRRRAGCSCPPTRSTSRTRAG